MSNYPPGVSGNEYEIAGPDHEWEEEFECTNEKFEYIMIAPFSHKFCSDMGKKIHRTTGQEDLNNNTYYYASMINQMFNSPSITKEIQYKKCEFVGEVSKQSYRKEIWWSCPYCGKDYSEYENNEQY